MSILITNDGNDGTTSSYGLLKQAVRQGYVNNQTIINNVPWICSATWWMSQLRAEFYSARVVDEMRHFETRVLFCNDNFLATTIVDDPKVNAW